MSSTDIIREVACDLRLVKNSPEDAKESEPDSGMRRRGWLGLFR